MNGKITDLKALTVPVIKANKQLAQTNLNTAIADLRADTVPVIKQNKKDINTALNTKIADLKALTVPVIKQNKRDANTAIKDLRADTVPVIRTLRGEFNTAVGQIGDLETEQAAEDTLALNYFDINDADVVIPPQTLQTIYGPWCVPDG